MKPVRTPRTDQFERNLSPERSQDHANQQRAYALIHARVIERELRLARLALLLQGRHWALRFEKLVHIFGTLQMRLQRNQRQTLALMILYVPLLGCIGWIFWRLYR